MYHAFRNEEGKEYGSFEVYWLGVHESNQYDSEGNVLQHGWYWQACFPGCLPDGDCVGPFESEVEAVEDARGEVILT